MQQPATVIYYTIQGVRKFIINYSVREDNKIIPTYTEDKEKAHHFDESVVEEMKGRILNHHNRVFYTEAILAPKAKIHSFTQRGRDALV